MDGCMDEWTDEQTDLSNKNEPMRARSKSLCPAICQGQAHNTPQEALAKVLNWI